MIFEKVKEVIANQLELDPETITMEASLIDDLQADSLDVMDMIMQFEEAFDIEVDEDSLDGIKTVGDIVSYFENHTK
ncbi:MAG: acyl carrier protein [Eubacteriaceae bacterium]|nr:acyl carrier protein [Eubacteriaceae bacterium]MBQ1466276.1 acyl carrier protein [Eubacteriaceae bacterium]MBR2781220.1 acyl carrier protein [Eubacteriaceae bacterium]MCR4894627.1 acyl carrier protein [Eubacteriales bacterium]